MRFRRHLRRNCLKRNNKWNPDKINKPIRLFRLLLPVDQGRTLLPKIENINSFNLLSFLANLSVHLCLATFTQLELLNKQRFHFFFQNFYFRPQTAGSIPTVSSSNPSFSPSKGSLPRPTSGAFSLDFAKIESIVDGGSESSSGLLGVKLISHNLDEILNDEPVQLPVTLTARKQVCYI